ncbi:MAG: PASTA domain-containing protein [Prolixibacteraceae bacterium]
MSFAKFLKSRKFLTHLLLAVVVAFILIVITLQGLKWYTLHGEANPVPDFEGRTVKEAIQIARQNQLRLKIIDSVYVDNAPPGVIVDQVPDKQHEVKRNRTVFLTLNSTQPEMVELPRLTDISFRQAQVLIENSGLQIGEISYQPSEYDNLVLNVQIDSTNIPAGKKLPKGTSVDLVLGRTRGNKETPLPDVTGLTVEQAEQMLTDAMLNTGVFIYDKSIVTKDDSIHAVVWRQRPSPKVTGTVDLASSVDLWLTVDELKIEEAIEQEF